MADRCLVQQEVNRMSQHTLVRETEGKETPIKYPKTIPIIVVITSLPLLLPLPYDFLDAPLQTKQQIFLKFTSGLNCQLGNYGRM